MILSHQHRFIFIKTRKTAGTSIEVFLSQHCEAEDVVTPIQPRVEPHLARHYKGIWNPLPELLEGGLRRAPSTLLDLAKRKKFYNHVPAWRARHRISKEIWESYFKFCVERNPWDKTLSHYHRQKDRARGRLTFDEYIERHEFCLNYPLYADSDGHLLVDRVLRYESLADDLQALFDELGIPFDGDLGVRAKSQNRTDRRPYREVLSGDQKSILDAAFAKEIDAHGYRY